MPHSKPVDFIPARGMQEYLVKRFFYRVVGKRCPKQGEYYLSGAIVQAWQAPNDLTDVYTVVKKTYSAKRIIVEVPDYEKQ